MRPPDTVCDGDEDKVEAGEPAGVCDAVTLEGIDALPDPVALGDGS